MVQIHLGTPITKEYIPMLYQEWLEIKNVIADMPLGSKIQICRADRPVIYIGEKILNEEHTVWFNITECAIEKEMVGMNFGFDMDDNENNWIQSISIIDLRPNSVKQILKGVRNG